MSLYDSGGATLVGNTFSGCGLWIRGSSVEDCRMDTVSNNTVNGRPLVFWQDATGSVVPEGAGQVVLVNCTEVTVQNQNIENANVGVDLVCTTVSTVRNNTLTNSSILLHRSEACTVQGNTITTQGEDSHGIHLIDSEGCTLQGNKVEGGEVGIILWESGRCTIQGNTVTNSGDGIDLWDSAECTVENNTVTGCEYSGLYIWCSDECMILNNTSTGCAGYGICLYASSCLVQRCTITGCGDDGVAIKGWGGQPVQVQWCRVTSCGGDGVEVEAGCRGVTVSNCTLTGNKGNGLSLGEKVNDSTICWNVLEGKLQGDGYDAGFNNSFLHNWWTGYTGGDTDGDGFGDTAHPVPGPAGSTDPHPLIYPPWPPHTP